MSSNKTLITTGQLATTIISSIMGVEIMYMQNGIIKYAKQDACISTLIGAIYPLYMIFAANYMCKKYPEDNILSLSKKCFGSIMGSILNFIFSIYFLSVLTTELAGLTNVFRVYATSFLKRYQIFISVMLPIAYISYKGLKTLVKCNETIFYLTIILIVVPVGALFSGSYLNVMPVFDNSIIDIGKGAVSTIFPYTGAECVFWLYPFLDNKKNLLKVGIFSCIYIAFIYSLTVFFTIYYFGSDICLKFLWPFLTLADAVTIPIINSIRYIFISLWALIVFKCIATYYFSCCFCVSNVLKNFSIMKVSIVLYPIAISLALLYGNPTFRRSIENKVTIVYFAFNILYVSLIVFLIHIKKR
ncbi:GerAB/ArcD/ProY family transporter [Clostridium sp. 19966]|uniref:GerAB/ArcD/ProY family transporter n=1 Tax=Clostridium sp. 19966 TaxID=2768166 RepID=UPI0028DE1110|nr:GerAB/ArcD/ProY family transporter [Clostridium sp. 19966]MDT8718544.1 GerAB/ArcD/ProY family transporter [Clostridium sp. 19966]